MPRAATHLTRQDRGGLAQPPLQGWLQAKPSLPLFPCHTEICLALSVYLVLEIRDNIRQMEP